MSENESQEVPAAQQAPPPFEPAAANFSGCGKPAILGCLVVAVLLGVAMLLVISKSDDVFRWLMAQVKQETMASLPEDLTASEIDRLERAFASAAEAVTSGRIDAGGLEKVQKVFKMLGLGVREGESYSRDQILEITRLLEEVGGTGGPDEVPDPVDAPAGAAVTTVTAVYVSQA